MKLGSHSRQPHWWIKAGQLALPFIINFSVPCEFSVTEHALCLLEVTEKRYHVNGSQKVMEADEGADWETMNSRHGNAKIRHWEQSRSSPKDIKKRFNYLQGTLRRKEVYILRNLEKDFHKKWLQFFWKTGLYNSIETWSFDYLKKYIWSSLL